MIEGWPSALRAALTNLVFNALDALPQGGTIRLAAYRAGLDGVAIEVADSGIGMPSEVAARAFDPFFTTKGEQGTGLGLSLVARIAQQHGAEVSVETGPNRGTQVRITFPTPRGPASKT